MFSFFRKHQRFFYAATAIFVATSLISFGTRGALTKGDQCHLFKTPGGRRYERKELEALERFLAREAMEGNPLNDGIISSDFLKKGLALQLAGHFKQEIGGDLLCALPRELRWQPYLHPQIPALNQKMFWSYFCPTLAARYENFANFSSSSDSTQLFGAKRDLWLAQSELPAEQLRRAILDQSSARNIDVHIAPGDLELFGYRNFKDWFGPHFMRLAAQVVLLGAEEAQKLGVDVSLQETKADLIAAAARLQSLYGGAQKRAKRGAEIGEFYHLCQQLSGLSEKELLTCWRQILLFRHFTSARQQSWGLDASLPIALSEFANREQGATFYTLDDNLYIDTPQKWEQFEIYCRLVATDQIGDDRLPEQFKEPSALWKIAPSLLQSPCRVSRLIIKKSQLRANFPQRLVTQWLLDEKNWERVSCLIPTAGSAELLSTRSTIIESLKPQERDRLDQLARKALFDQDPKILESALDRPKEELEWMFNGAGLSLPFPSVKRQSEFAELIKKAWNSDPDAARALLRYEADEDTVISLSLLNTPCWEIAPWEKALSKGWIKEIQASQRPPNCSDEELVKVKKRVQDLARRVDHPTAWLNWRAFGTLERVRNQLRAGKPIKSALKDGEGLTFFTQWQLLEKSEQIQRKSFEVEKWPDLFAEKILENGWSKVQWNQKPLGFYQITPVQPPLQEGQLIIPALDPQLIHGAERARHLLAIGLDQEVASQWLDLQMGNLRPISPSIAETGAEHG